jgi:hypothetical protein
MQPPFPISDTDDFVTIPKPSRPFYLQPAAILYAIYLLYICKVTWYLATEYPIKAGIYPVTPFLFFFDTFDLYIHEAGHLFFSPCGDLLHIMGGSLFQVILPTIAAVVFVRSGLFTLGFTLFWVGESIVNVSVYVRDAPFMRLHLISRYCIHDWNWICRRLDIMDSADDIATMLLFLGVAVCIGAVAAGVWSIIRDSRTAAPCLSAARPH